MTLPSVLVYLALVAVGERVSKRHQRVELAGILASRSGPSGIDGSEFAFKVAHAQATEIHAQGCHGGVTGIDGTTARDCSCQQRVQLRRRSGDTHDVLCREIVQVPGEALKLGYQTQDVGVCQWPPELKRTARSVDLSHSHMCFGD